MPAHNRKALRVLTINSGSSSIKTKIIAMPHEAPLVQLNIADVGLKRGTWKLTVGERTIKGTAAFPDYETGLTFILHTLFTHRLTPITGPSDLDAVAHRVVHGGPRYVESTLITDAVVRGIQANRKLAPLHTPPNLQGIRTARKILRKIPHVAVFDTGFHKTMPDYAAAYALPYRFFARHNIRRYGFHGISYRYVIDQAAQMLGKPLRSLKIIACHLGSGCSVCAIDGGRSVDTSMGFTPVEGLMMRTRVGDIDAGVVLHLQREMGYSPQQLNKLLNHRSGFFGISDGAATMPEVIKRMRAGDERAKLAFEMFCYRVEKYIGAYVATLGGLDALIFTAGIGENQPDVRAQIVKWCRGFGLHIDAAKNQRACGVAGAIHAKKSTAAILVIPTNEELMMARDAFAIA